MLTHHIALVDDTGRIDAGLLSQTAAALQTQAMRDLAPIWKKEATVTYFPHLEHVPPGFWPIILSDKINQRSDAGYHTDKNHQPFALVAFDKSWQLTCSHEMCEMLVDPWGNRLHTAPGPRGGYVQYLVEVCDPCEDASCAYEINGIQVSDFYTPHFFDPSKSAGVRYSFTGSITSPLTVKSNGYLSWHDPKNGKWYQAIHFGKRLQIKELKGIDKQAGSLRSRVDRLTKSPKGLGPAKSAAVALHPSSVKHWKGELKGLVKEDAN